MRAAPWKAELEIELSVRDRLYGGRREVTATPVASPRPAPLGRLFGGRYRVLDRLGAGGRATVYRARDERLKRDVAIKVIAERLARDPVSVRRFRREAELCARLAHPNVVAVLDTGFAPRDFIVMELLRGVDAETLLRRRGPLPPGETVHVVAQVCEALACAHEQDVIHHDVSTRNILLEQPRGTAKLVDFGLASDALDVPLRRVADIEGTSGFVAPEVLRGAGPSPRSDLYSIGMVAYRLLAGSMPRGLEGAVQQAIAIEPEARQDSVAEFRAQLVGVRDELPLAA